MKCKEGHSKEQMESQGLLFLPEALRKMVISQQLTKCPFDNSDILFEISDFNLVSG